MTELKCCRCGNRHLQFGKRLMDGAIVFCVMCEECGAMSSFEDTKAEAIDAWNRRTGKEATDD